MKRTFIGVLIVTPFLAGIKIYMLAYMLEMNQEKLGTYITVQSLLISNTYSVLIDLVTAILLLILGIKMKGYFGYGLRKILLETSDSFITQNLV